MTNLSAPGQAYFEAGRVMLWNDTETLAKLARWAPYVFIVLGFIVAVGGQFVKSKLDERVKSLEALAEKERRNTPPQLDAQLAISDKGNIFTVVDSYNLIPFRARWLVVSEKDHVVSGLMLEDVEFHPSLDTKRWKHKENINLGQVTNAFVELRYHWQSLYYAELGHPEHLHGEVRYRYRLVNGAPQPEE